MSFSFNPDDDDTPFNLNELAKMFQQMQADMMRQLREQGIDPQDLINQMLKSGNTQSFGFSFSIGPDGTPSFQPLNPQNVSQGSGGPQKSNGFEEPFTDTFFSEEAGYQIIVEVPGIEDPRMVHLRIKDGNLLLHAETGPFKYRSTIQLEHDVDGESLSYSLRNGVLEILIKTKQ